jgi:uncharacterized protein with von Willebrand factor type A (vWA) domain
MNKRQEIVRLSDNQPLTLACSALADFLWDDFVRDARPQVNYLADQYNINQLSRFGKEVFERLYSGDNVSWLVDLNAWEEYFRAKQNGEKVVYPRGYKPEDSFWYGLMDDLTNSAAWHDLMMLCVGDQWNAGNTAVNILNELSEVLEELIEDLEQLAPSMLSSNKDKLEKIRQEFQEAKDAGDDGAAAVLREEGKKLGAVMEQHLMEAGERISSRVDEIVDKAKEETEQTNEGISKLHGSDAGTGKHTNDLNQKRELAKRLRQNKKLRAIANRLGFLRRIWTERKKARRAKASYEAIAGAAFSNEVVKAFPNELALAATPQGRALFALKYSQRSLLTKDYEAHRKDLGKGPIVMYIDVSGSMTGETEIWSKAIALLIAEEALKQKRGVQIHLFDVRITDSVSLDATRADNNELLDFVATWHLGGGTSFNAVLAHAVTSAKITDKTDILMITDGHSEVHDHTIRNINAMKERTGAMWSTICIETDAGPILNRFSDEVHTVDLTKTAESIDCIQRCIR